MPVIPAGGARKRESMGLLYATCNCQASFRVRSRGDLRF